MIRYHAFDTGSRSRDPSDALSKTSGRTGAAKGCRRARPGKRSVEKIRREIETFRSLSLGATHRL